MRVKIIETCVYEVEAEDGDVAERLYLANATVHEHEAIAFVGVTARHVIEQPEPCQVVPIR